MATLTYRRRGTVFLAALLGSALFLSGCSTTDPDETAPATPNSDDAFPVTIDTAYGEITVDEKPERIVALNAELLDALVALDEEPTAFAGYVETEEELISQRPWLEGIYTSDLVPELVGEDYKAAVEAIASWEPDLIVGTIWTIDESLYEQLSQIAPTYAGVDPDSNTDWDVTVRALASLTGKTDEAERVTAEVDAAFADARDRLPGLQGKTYNGGSYRDQNFILAGGKYWEDLGLLPADGQPDSLGGNSATVSLENLDQLTADVLVFWLYGDPDAQAEIESDPRFAELPAVENGTVVWSNNQQATAVSPAGPHSFLWWLEEVVPLLEQSALNQAGQ